VRVAIVGAGAVGSFLGAVLALAGEEVTLLSRGDAPAAPATLGLAEPDGSRREARLARQGVDAIDRDPPPDVLVLAVKQPALPDAIRAVARWPAVATVTAQNGIGAEALVRDRRATAPLVAASLTSSVELDGPERVVRLRRGGLGLAPVTRGAVPVARDLATAFRRGGLRTAIVPSADAMKWSKLLANLVANAAPAVLDLDPEVVYADPRLFDVERRQLLETLAVMRALGLRPVALPGADARMLALGIRVPAAVARPVLARLVAVARGGKAPSLRLHLAMGEGPLPESEVAWLNGAVARVGGDLGVPTPVNAALVDLVESAVRDPAARATLRHRPDRLLDAITASIVSR
jgi:2-dehydropantoate 2-reductase